MDRCLLSPVEREILHRVGTFYLAHATNQHYKQLVPCYELLRYMKRMWHFPKTRQSFMFCPLGELSQQFTHSPQLVDTIE